MDKKPAPMFKCEGCGKPTKRREVRYKDGRLNGYNLAQRFCSAECGWDGRKWRPINPEGHVHSTGYIRVNLRGGIKEFKHRLVMVEILGRPLRKLENVHHKDGDKLNNAPNNLELWTKQQPAGQRVTDKVAFAIEILTLYPEFCLAAGYELQKHD